MFLYLNALQNHKKYYIEDCIFYLSSPNYLNTTLKYFNSIGYFKLFNSVKYNFKIIT